MQTIIAESYEEASRIGAYMIREQLNRKADSVLGFATGGTPEGLYAELVRAYKAGEVDFSRASSFNMDEYYPIKKSNSQSYDYFMREHLINHINMPPEQFHIPNGEAEDPEAECVAYDRAILRAGRVDLFLCGLGVNGHVAFNEPGDFLHAGTHMETLTDSTIEANARFFARAEDVPRKALTIGLGTLLKSRRLLLLGIGRGKAEAIRTLYSGKVTTEYPISFLQLHPDVTVILDKEAAALI
ncbi:glucosamine-6-phosphate deaminase [Oscillospiraceae bacterium OttesenSCG-928-F05]|nr:glucosamine-6-phosphate deaminase [Oscillospiraceae bacterium OttesenSCG-928-F05]